MEKKEFTITEDLLASKGQRFANYIIDVIIIYILIIIVTFVVTIVSIALDSTEIIERLKNIGTLETYLIFFSIMIPYYTLFEAKSSRTIGKFISKTMVIMEDGSKPDLGTSLKRTLCRIIPFEIFSFLSSDGRGWHDTIPNIYVVKKEDFERERELFYSFEEIGTSQES